MTPARAPCDVVLVGTSNPENLGATARLLDNFGIGVLWLVAPRVAADDPKALVVARTARERLAGARVVATLAEAVAGATYVVGLTARSGDRRETVNLRDVAARLAIFPPSERVAFVFGPEDTGLSNEDTDACDLLCTIPTRGPLASLNLAQAVAITLWEVSQAGAPASAPDRVRGGATRAELEGFLDHAFEVLARFSYFRDKDEPRRRTELRRVLASAGLTADEIKGLRGVCRQALWALERAEAGASASDEKPD